MESDRVYCVPFVCSNCHAIEFKPKKCCQYCGHIWDYDKDYANEDNFPQIETNNRYMKGGRKSRNFSFLDEYIKSINLN